MTAVAGHPWAEWVVPEAHLEGRMPGGLSRWSAGKDLSWEPLRPELVVEVAYSAMLAGRFRATTQFKRWRPDRDPRTCTSDQLEEPARLTLDDVLAAQG
jgi:ATP-dependent DNA ligase